MFRRWPMADSDSARGDEKMPDLGRAVVFGPGDGEGEFRAKGLLRDVRAKGRPPFGAGALMVEEGAVVITIVSAGAVCVTLYVQTRPTSCGTECTTQKTRLLPKRRSRTQLQLCTRMHR